MEPHIERMLNEQKELKEKVAKLRTFIEENPIFGKLPEEEQHDMRMQLNAMEKYSSILQSRIDRATA